MTREEKDLLLRDLCGRLPYGVKANTKDGDCDLIGFVCDTFYVEYPEAEILVDRPVEETKPYLFPLSSITEEQKEELRGILRYNALHIPIDTFVEWFIGGCIESEVFTIGISTFGQVIDSFHRHHLDYHGLIDRNLAVDCTNLNIY